MRHGWRHRRDYPDYTRRGGNEGQIGRDGRAGWEGQWWGNGRILGLIGSHPEWTERHWRQR